MRTRKHASAWSLLLFAVAIGAVGCSGEGPSVETVIEPPVPERLTQMGPALVEHIEHRLSAVREDSNDAQRWMRLGLLYEAHEIYELALECYEHAARLDPERPRAWYHLALMRRETGDVAAAIASLERVSELETAYAPAWWRRGYLWLELGRLDDAESAFLEARRIAPHDTAARTGLARVALRRGDAGAAVRILEGLLAEGQGQPYLHYLLGSAYRRLEQWGRAEFELMKGRDSQARWLDPWGLEAMGHRVEFYALLKEAKAASDRGQSEVAIALMEDLLRRKPDDRRTLTGLSRAYLRTGRDEEGIRLAHRMHRLYPDHFEVQLTMALTYEHTGDLERALDHADRSLELNPEFAAAHRRRGTILARQGRFRDAVTEFERAVKLAPEDTLAWTSLGDCLVQLGRWSEASASFDRALRLAPEDARTLVRAGFVRLQLGDLPRAEAALVLAERLSPGGSVPARMMLDQLRQRNSGDRGNGP